MPDEQRGRKPEYRNGKSCPSQRGDENGAYTRKTVDADGRALLRRHRARVRALARVIRAAAAVAPDARAAWLVRFAEHAERAGDFELTSKPPHRSSPDAERQRRAREQTEQRHRYVIEAPAQLTREQWIAKYSPTPEVIPASPPTITQ
jgi:hypothetical protein